MSISLVKAMQSNFAKQIDVCLDQIPLDSWADIRAARRTVFPDGRWWVDVTECNESGGFYFEDVPDFNQNSEDCSEVLLQVREKIRALAPAVPPVSVRLNGYSRFVKYVTQKFGPLGNPLPDLMEAPLDVILYEKLEEKIKKKAITMAQPGDGGSNPKAILEALKIEIQRVNNFAKGTIWKSTPEFLRQDKQFVLGVLRMCGQECHASDVHSVNGAVEMAREIVVGIPEAWNDDRPFGRQLVKSGLPYYVFE
jgi:hypothetical protein